jgi:CRP-like cAMP-binding protein
MLGGHLDVAGRPPNQVLASLRPVDLSLLEGQLSRVNLQAPEQLESPRRPIEHVYFIESGFASVVVNGYSRRPVEIGLIGREGMTGLAVLMADDRSPSATHMQVSGAALRVTAADLRAAMSKSVTLHQSLLRSAHLFHVQTTQTALINIRCTVEERLARWLLMAHDRINCDELLFTHELLSLKLGIRRASVTETLHTMAKKDLIAIRRGAIAIVDRVRLQKSSNGAYCAPKRE